MLGFLFGVAFAFFVTRALRGGRFARGSYSRRRRRREWALDRLSARLDTTPSQDRVLGEALDTLFDAFAEERRSFFGARSAFSSAVRGEEFDGASLDELKGEQDQALGRVHAAVTDALARAHAVLDDEQRATLAEVIEQGPHGRCRGRQRRAA